MSLNSTTSLFNITQVAIDTARTGCTPHYSPISVGQIKYAIACISINATSSNAAKCLVLSQDKIPLTADCNYITTGAWNKNVTKREEPVPMYCYSFCSMQLSASASASILGPSSASASASASASNVSSKSVALTLYPSFAITFAALFFVMLMMSFKRDH